MPISLSFDEGASAGRRHTFDDFDTEDRIRSAARLAARRARSAFREQRLLGSARRARARWVEEGDMPVSERDFVVEATVGSGSFGEVFRVRKVGGGDAGDVYAMKLVAGKQNEQERRMLLAVEHPFVVRLRHAFTSRSGHSCLVMDFAPRGTLEGHLDARAPRRALGLGAARLVAAEVGIAILSLHGLGIIHRDIKPANVLVDDAGHCLVSDLGRKRVRKSQLQRLISRPFPTRFG